MEMKQGLLTYNIGASDYAQMDEQPWELWDFYKLTDPWDCDIVKRVMRRKGGEEKRLDWKKCEHICRYQQWRVEMGLKNYTANFYAVMKHLQERGRFGDEDLMERLLKERDLRAFYGVLAEYFKEIADGQ